MSRALLEKGAKNRAHEVAAEMSNKPGGAVVAAKQPRRSSMNDAL